jgi:hypothetical protein
MERTSGLLGLGRRVNFFQTHGPQEKMKDIPIHVSAPKREWFSFCTANLEGMRKVPLPVVMSSSKLQSVIVESRVLPYLEFIIRNTILRLGPGWSHTIVATLENADFIKGMVAQISPEIEVITIPIASLSINGYNSLLTAPAFWKLLHGNKILVYQHDTFLFRSGIDPFLKYDYIGAPWEKRHNMTYYKQTGTYGVGNGGLSLRSRRHMLEILGNVPWENWTAYSIFTRIWMKWKGVNGPEDIFFSQLLPHCKQIMLPNLNIARSFSVERVYHPNPLGGHQWWWAKYDWKSALRRNLLKDFRNNGCEMRGL